MNKNKIITLIAAAGVVIALVVLILIEEGNGGYLRITNNTDRNITGIEISFYDEEQEMTVDYMYSGSVDAGGKINYAYKDDGGYYYFSGLMCICEIAVTFDGYDTIYIEDGEFTSDFKGNFEFDFTQEGGDYFLTTKASEGLFKTTRGTMMDTDFILNLPEADWDYVF